MSSRRPKTEVLSLDVTDTEYSWKSQGRLNRVIIKARSAVAVRISDTIGLVATSTDPYFTLAASASLTLDNLESSELILYFAQTSVGAVVLEIMTIC